MNGQPKHGTRALVLTLFDPLFPDVPSLVPVVATDAVLASIVPLATLPDTVARITTAVLALLARPAEIRHVIPWMLGVQPGSDPAGENVVPAGSLSLMAKPPTFAEGPLLVTVIV